MPARHFPPALVTVEDLGDYFVEDFGCNREPRTGDAMF
jgi:hypothetical protein